MASIYYRWKVTDFTLIGISISAQLRPPRRESIRQTAQQQNISVQEIRPRHLDEGNFIHLGRKEPEFQKIMLPLLLETIELDSVINILLARYAKKEISD